MFGNLVESGSHKGDNARKSSFFIGTLAVYALAFLAIGVGSIYAYNTHVDNQDLRLVSLVAPTEPSEAPTPQRRSAPRPAAAGSKSSVAVVRTPPLITRMDPQLVPNHVSVAPPVPEMPQGTIFKIGIPTAGDNNFGGSTGNKTPGDGSGDNGSGNSSKMDELVRETPPPPPIKKEVAKPAEPRTISKGVVNGQATSLPRPVYTQIAKAAHASGLVTVQVLIDETGKVISAHALNGHPLLLKEAVQAAYQARFTPTLLSNQAVKVSGIITYNFVMQ
ncbi:MAG: periplasmic protein TonB [Acidobacteriota bacterium]|jgi:TonB family protein|nr:periplasmic protein TonB [Acidobacteriota bacterium]